MDDLVNAGNAGWEAHEIQEPIVPDPPVQKGELVADRRYSTISGGTCPNCGGAIEHRELRPDEWRWLHVETGRVHCSTGRVFGTVSVEGKLARVYFPPEALARIGDPLAALGVDVELLAKMYRVDGWDAADQAFLLVEKEQAAS